MTWSRLRLRQTAHAALDRGVYFPPSPYEVSFLSLAHTESVLDRALDAIRGAAMEADRL